jgi:HK97 family phage prohead protease
VKVKSLPVQFKAGPEDGLNEGEFIVYPSTFTRQPDAYGDVVAKGAFLEDIAARKEAGLTLPGLFGHRMDDPDFWVASAIEETEDDHGWQVKGAFDLDSPKGAQVYRLVKSKRLNQLSFAYETLEEGRVELEDGDTANELRKVRVFEFSFVPVGANQDTSVLAVKSAIDALAADVKAGRVLSAKNESALREAAEKLDGATQDIKNVLAQLSEATEGKASGSGEAKSDEEPPAAKSDEEQSPSPSVVASVLEADVIAASV